jgi:hypothetical protein
VVQLFHFGINSSAQIANLTAIYPAFYGAIRLRKGSESDNELHNCLSFMTVSCLIVVPVEWGCEEKRHKKTRREKDQRAPQFGDFKEKQWHLL